MDAFKQYAEQNPSLELTFETWKKQIIEKSPTFQYWDAVLEFEIQVLHFIKAHRTRDFSLYVESLEALVPWFFALDHTHYSRWIPIHIHDMKALPEEIKEDLGQFLRPGTSSLVCPLTSVISKTQIVKGSGGAVGLTENPTAFRRWMVAGPEQARLLEEFEAQCLKENGPDSLQHHEQHL